jgi:hypothetical protein
MVFTLNHEDFKLPHLHYFPAARCKSCRAGRCLASVEGQHGAHHPGHLRQRHAGKRHRAHGGRQRASNPPHAPQRRRPGLCEKPVCHHAACDDRTRFTRTRLRPHARREARLACRRWSCSARSIEIAAGHRESAAARKFVYQLRGLRVHLPGQAGGQRDEGGGAHLRGDAETGGFDLPWGVVCRPPEGMAALPRRTLRNAG